jgi:uncharacterized protein YbcV (DUF1398 family)
MGQSWSKARRYDPGLADVAQFDREELIAALRTDQAGKGFHEFLLEIVRYAVDCTTRTCTYYGCEDEHSIESYPAASVAMPFLRSWAAG